jgi:hypothetical protein
MAEYNSAALSAQLLHWLIQLGVSPDSISACHRIVQEEFRHAELSREVLLQLGGSPEAIHIPYEQLTFQLDKEAPVPFRALSLCAQTFCCGESTAVPLFKALLEHSNSSITDPVLKQILHDEAGHKVFGWTVLDELLELMGEVATVWLRKRVPDYIEELRESYDCRWRQCSEEEMRYGAMPGILYKEISERCIEEVLIPRFKARALLD